LIDFMQAVAGDVPAPRLGPEEVSDTELLSDAAIIKITLNVEFVMSSRIRISAKTGLAPLPIVIVVAVWMVSRGSSESHSVGPVIEVTAIFPTPYRMPPAL
jgi:hypothetical protein